MQFSDERLWQEFVRVYCVDEHGGEIIDFTRRWAETFEEIMGPFSAEPLPRPELKPSFRQALDSAFLSSLDLPGQPGLKANSDMVREAIFLLVQCWEHADELVQNLTPIEVNILETAMNMKITSMQEQAAEEAEEQEKH